MREVLAFSERRCGLRDDGVPGRGGNARGAIRTFFLSIIIEPEEKVSIVAWNDGRRGNVPPPRPRFETLPPETGAMVGW